MVIGSKQKVCEDKQLTLRLNETVLENVTCQKVLGVIIDNNLNWHKHIDYRKSRNKRPCSNKRPPPIFVT